MFTINAGVREEQGKGAGHHLRAVNKFLTIVYDGGEAPLAIELNHNEIMDMQAKAEFYSEALTTVVDSKEIKAKAQDAQCHPYKPELQYIDSVRA